MAGIGNGFLGIDNELLLILLFIAIFSGGFFGLGTQGKGGGFLGRDDDLIFFIILLLLFTGGFNFFGLGSEK